MTVQMFEEASPTVKTELFTNLTVAEFFAGIGLVRMGLEKQGWQIIFANDIDQQKYNMYKGHFTDAENHFLVGDVHKIGAEVIPTVTLATASFPCTDLSLAGGRIGINGVNSGAFWGFANILEAMGDRKPPFVLLENVSGLLTSNGGKDLETVLLTLNNLGYSVDILTIDASRFVPQSRPRFFVIAIKKDITSKGAIQISDVRPRKLIEYIRYHPSINWHTYHLPDLPLRDNSLETILENLPDTALEWWSLERSEYLLNQMSVRHREIVDKWITDSKWSYGTVFRRMRYGKSMAELRSDGIAGCLRTPKGGSAKQILLKAGYGKFFARLLTPRECARLMGADDFNITTNGDQALFGFGDAVCVPVIEWIAKYYLNPIASEILERQELVD